jgi:hypothetical protein
MTKPKARNTALASHIAGSRGAGRHVSAERKYTKGKDEYLDDTDIAPLDEVADAIVELISQRAERGLGNSRLSDLLVLGSAADVKRRLDDLVAVGRLVAFDILICGTCGRTTETALAKKKQICCNSILLRKIGESFSA